MKELKQLLNQREKEILNEAERGEGKSFGRIFAIVKVNSLLIKKSNNVEDLLSFLDACINQPALIEEQEKESEIKEYKAIKFIIKESHLTN